MLQGWIGNKWDASKIPDLSNSNIIVTGGTSGLGFEAAKQLLKKNAHVFILSGNLENGKQALDELQKEVPKAQVDFLECDLADFQAVKRCAAAFKSMGVPLHVLINNAGRFLPETEKTTDGFDIQYKVNYYGHLYLTHLLLDDLKQSTPARIVWMSSPAESAGQINWEDLKGGQSQSSGFREYGTTNLMRLMAAVEMNERLNGTGVDVFVVEPGVTDTPIFDKMDTTSKPMAWLMWGMSRLMGGAQSVERGALSMLYAATAPELDGKGGTYWGTPYYFGQPLNAFNTSQRTPQNPAAKDPLARRRLYDESIALLEDITGEAVPNVLPVRVEAKEQ